jgi:sugar phosphate isomerase/epimerase
MRKLKHHLFGMHVHDSNFVNDHIAPGMGEIDFRPIFERAPADALMVLELAATVTEEEIRAGVAYLLSV